MTQYAYSRNEEYFGYDNLYDLLSDEELAPGNTVYRGIVMPIDIKNLIDADDVIETIGERAWDQAGEVAEDYPDVSADARNELNCLLQGWIKKHCMPTFYTVQNAEQYEITEEDVKCAQA